MALAAFAVLAAGSFSLGLQHQLNGSSTDFPSADAAGLQAYVDAIPDATPARDEVATAVPPVLRINASLGKTTLDKTMAADLAAAKDPVAALASPVTEVSATVAESPVPSTAQADPGEPPT